MDKRLTVPKQCLLFGQKLYESKHSVAYTAIYAFSLLLASIFLLEVFFFACTTQSHFQYRTMQFVQWSKKSNSLKRLLPHFSVTTELDGFSLVCCATVPRCAGCIHGDIGLALTPQPEGFFFCSGKTFFSRFLLIVKRLPNKIKY